MLSEEYDRKQNNIGIIVAIVFIIISTIIYKWEAILWTIM